MRLYFLTSIGRQKMSLEASQTRGTPSGGVGSVAHWVPKIVLLLVK
jgi:hypothetical protein